MLETAIEYCADIDQPKELAEHSMQQEANREANQSFQVSFVAL